MSALAISVGTLFFGIAATAAPRQEPIQPIEPPPEALDEDKVELGKMLFFDPRLSKSGLISCNSCHNLATGGVDNLPESVGHGWTLGPINSPTVLNAKYNIAQFWDGRAEDLQDQAGGPIANPKEMAATHERAEKVLETIPGYRKRFKDVYGDEDITIDEITDAIAVFEKTLVTPNSPFDQWLKGDDDALTALEKKGYKTFKRKGCIGCHNGPSVGGRSYQKFGLAVPYEKTPDVLGRYNVTGEESDKYVFKVPNLRNVELTYPYFHDGSVWTLEEAVDLMAKHQLGRELSDDENKTIVAFLKTLTGEQPDVDVPKLPPSTGETPKPVTALKK